MKFISLAIGIFVVLNFGVLPHVAEPSDSSGTTEKDEWNDVNSTMKRNYNLTGIPQIDYVHDPNLPRELNGYNLSTYPFFTRVPKNINFSCDGLKDGFYASVKHGCQPYHHCLYGTRHDFLCANYTAFDQRTFICQFVSEVDCPNSALFFHRNDALYQTPSTTTPAPVVIYVGPSGRRIRPSPLLQNREDPPISSKKVPPDPRNEPKHKPEDEDYHDPQPIRDRFASRRRNRGRRCGPGRRRRCRRPRPRPEYYDYYDYDDYYDTTERRKKPKFRDRDREYDYDYENTEDFEKLNPVQKKRTRFKENEFESRLGGTSTRSPVSKTKSVPMSVSVPTSTPVPAPVIQGDPGDPIQVAGNRDRIFSKSRAPPKIRPPVPLREKSRFGSIQGRPEDFVRPVTITTTTTLPPTTVSSSPAAVEYEEYYEDEEPPTTYRNHVLGKLPTPLPPRVTTVRTTATTSVPPITTTESQYEYEYEEYDDTTTTVRPEPITFKDTGSSRRFQQAQPRQEGTELVEERRRAPGVEHQKINEALEAPSRASLRIPYHNKPRPSFLKNAQMLQPLTTERAIATTTPPLTPFESTFDGVNKRFPVFDTDTRLPLETVSAAAERQRHLYRARESTTTPESIAEEYMGFEEVDPDEVTDRYGPQYSDSVRAQFTPVATSSRMSSWPQVPQARAQTPLTFQATPGSRSFSQDNPVPSSNAYRPEFISLMSDDEPEPQPVPRSRLRSSLMRSSAQTLYPSYVPVPQGYDYVRTQRHVHPYRRGHRSLTFYRD